MQTDIPYGDYFRVESRWEITPAGDDACVAWVGLRIPFQRSTMLRKVIEQSALEESRKSVEQALALAAAMIERSDGGGVVPRGGSVGEDAEETGGGGTAADRPPPARRRRRRRIPARRILPGGRPSSTSRS